MKICPDHEKLAYCGRIDWRDRRAPVFVYPCTSVQMRFTGNILRIYVRNHRAYWDNYVGYLLDGIQGVLALPHAGEAEFEIKVEETPGNVHDFLLFKRQDACHEFAFLGAAIGEGEQVLEGPAKPGRCIEVYGDSVSAGEVSEALDFVGREDPPHDGEYSNSWYSYAWMTARKLHAQIHDIAQGGMALMDNTGWFHEPEAVGMETAWDKIHYHPALGAPLPWDFKRYTPQVVIVALGQNDSHPQDYMAQDYDGGRAAVWRSRYKDFLTDLRSVYPEAFIVCCTTLLIHDRAWDRAIGQVVRELGDEKISQYVFRRCGSATPGHLRIPEAEEMADELTAYIDGLGIEGWS